MGFLLVCFCVAAQAQNTKGDKPAPPAGYGKTPEKKFKLFKKKGGQRVGSSNQRSRNIYSQNGPFVHNPSKKGKKEKASNVRLPGNKPSFTPSGKDKAWTSGNAAGKRIRTTSSAGRIKNVYPQKGPFVHNPAAKPKQEKPNTVRLPSSVKTVRQPSGKDKSWKGGDISGAKIRTTKPPKRPTYSTTQTRSRINPASRAPRQTDVARNNQPLNSGRRLSISKAIAQSRSMGASNGFKTITGQFLTKGKKNVYWGKFRKKEKAITTDIAGRKLRTRNYQSPRPGLVGRDTLKFFKRSPQTIRRSPAQAGGGVRSATRSGRAWSGDISGSKIRRGKARPNRETAGEFFAPRRMSVTGKIKRDSGKRKSIQSATQTGKATLEPILGKAPGAGARAFSLFSKNAKPQKKLKGGGGTLSGKLWNNNNQPILNKAPGLGAQGYANYSKQAKGLKRVKGAGGTLSGKLWNNNNQPILGKSPGLGAQGYTKDSNQAKGLKRIKGAGGTVSGKLWNNNGQAIDVNKAGKGTINASQFRGRIKGIMGNPGVGNLGLNYSGAYKTKRPLKGGGSVSGKLWNNNGQPIDVADVSKDGAKVSVFQGKSKYKKKPHTAGVAATSLGKNKVPYGPGLSYEGLNYDGDYKRNDRGKIDNQHQSSSNSLLSKLFKTSKPKALPNTHIKRDEEAANYTLKGKRYFFNRYVQNPKADKESLKKDRAPDGLRLNVPILSQTRRSVNAGHYHHVTKQYWDYKRNPNSDKDALKVREPSKANARVADLQVNVKMKKIYHGDLHPDAKFANSYRDNVKEERTIFMNIRLTWAKLFKKSDNQPRGLKQKPTRPRYDPNEKGLWYD